MLSFDIEVEIIERLPVKSLIRFRSVCKSWKSLIHSSHFIAGYNSDQRQHLMITYSIGCRLEEEVKYVSFVDDDSFPQQKFSLIVPPLFQATLMIGSSHGLLCCFEKPGDFSGSGMRMGMGMAVLWNPAIRKSIVVDVPIVVHGSFNSVVGFGVCPDTKDPKLVRITCIDDDEELESICIPYQVMVFTLSSREWTCLRSSNLPRISIQFTCFQTVVGQFIYWSAYDRTAVVNGEDDSHNLIMSFNMSTHEFGEVQLPDSLSKLSNLALTISRIRESLAVIEYSTDLTRERVCSVWMMEHGDFTKLFTIDVPNASVSQTLGFRKSGAPIVEMEDDSAIVVYEPCSEHIKDLGIRGNRYSFFGSFYAESLLLFDHDDGHIGILSKKSIRKTKPTLKSHLWFSEQNRT